MEARIDTVTSDHFLFSLKGFDVKGKQWMFVFIIQHVSYSLKVVLIGRSKYEALESLKRLHLTINNN